MKLTRYPRSLAATLAAFPSVSLFPQLGLLNWQLPGGYGQVRMRPRHFALPARRVGSAASRKVSQLGVRGVFASPFDVSVIPSKVEESLDIISDTAAWPLAHDYRSLAASFRGLKSRTPCPQEDVEKPMALGLEFPESFRGFSLGAA